MVMVNQMILEKQLSSSLEIFSRENG